MARSVTVMLRKPGPETSIVAMSSFAASAGDDLAGELARVALARLGERQDAVGLEVGAVAAAQHRVAAGAGFRQRRCERVTETLLHERGERGDRHSQAA